MLNKSCEEKMWAIVFNKSYGQKLWTKVSNEAFEWNLWTKMLKKLFKRFVKNSCDTEFSTKVAGQSCEQNL